MLLPHNVPVHKEFERMIKNRGKVILITATGTGKSYVTKEYLDRNKLNGLVVCPKNAICDQWRALTNCVTPITYHALCRAKLSDLVNAYDCFIFDEAHHCGSLVWGAAVKRLMAMTDKPIIGLTADSRRHSDGGKDVALHLWDNCVVYGYDYAQAIQQKILPPTAYICTLFDADTVIREALKDIDLRGVSTALKGRLEYSAHNCRSVVNILHKHMPAGKRKGVVFADRIDTIKEAKALIQSAFPGKPILSAHSRQDRGVVERTIEKFVKLDEGYLVVVDLLNEGVHIQGVNTIIMLRRTFSPSLFMQQCGRGMSTVNKNVVIFDLVGNSQGLKTVLSSKQRPQIHSLFPYARSTPISTQTIIHDYASELLEVVGEIKHNLRMQELEGTWTREDDQILRKWYPKEGAAVNARLPGKTPGMCQRRAMTLGLQFGQTWTHSEDEILRLCYPLEGKAVAKRLPRHTPADCTSRAAQLGLTLTKASRWTEEEDLILSIYFPTEGAAVCQRLENRSAASCYTRARKLGLHDEV